MKKVKLFEDFGNTKIEEGDMVRLLVHNKWTVSKGFVIGREYEVINIKAEFKYPYEILNDNGDVMSNTWVGIDQIERVE